LNTIVQEKKYLGTKGIVLFQCSTMKNRGEKVGKDGDIPAEGKETNKKDIFC
jgi:hypothetical protein